MGNKGYLFIKKMPKSYRVCHQTSKTPRRPFEKERIEQELKVCGEYGLRCKREVWRVQLTLARLRKAARELLTLEEDDNRRIFEGRALMKRMFKYGLLNRDTENGLDYVLGMTVQKFLERRLQTRVFRNKKAKSIHHARCLINQRHIAVDNQLVNIPSFLVTVENENKIDLHSSSALGEGKPGRIARIKARGGAAEED